MVADSAILAPTMHGYRRGYRRFRKWLEKEYCGARGHSFPCSEDDIDDALAAWMASEMTRNPNRGNMELCANARRYILHYDSGSLRLKYSARMIAGWNKLVPPAATAPISRGLMLLMTQWFLDDDDLEMATIVSLSFECLMRPRSELLPRLMRDVSLPGAAADWTGSDCGALRLHGTKAKAHDCVDLLNDVSTFLLSIWQGRRADEGAGPRDRLFKLNSARMRLRFYECLEALGLGAATDHSYRPHSLRHGGATHMSMAGSSIRDIAHRGRWASDKSAEIYISAGRATEAVFPASKRLAKRARRLLRRPFRLLLHIQ